MAAYLVNTLFRRHACELLVGFLFPSPPPLSCCSLCHLAVPVAGLLHLRPRLTQMQMVAAAATGNGMQPVTSEAGSCVSSSLWTL